MMEVDSKLEEIDILVCKNGKFEYYRPTWFSGGKYRTTLKARQGVDLHFIANSRSVLENANLTEGMDWDDIRRQLIDMYTDRSTGGITTLPMWGIKESVDIEDGVTRDLGTVWLLRSVAAVEVEIGVNESIFKLAEVSLYYAPSAGIIVPLAANYNTQNDTYLAEMPQGATCTENYSITDITQNKMTSALYLYENKYTGILTTNDRRSRVLIGGYYKSSSKKTWYPLDFVDDNDDFMQIVRNHKYQFEVTSVAGEGYDDKEEAAKAPGVNIDYGIYEWRSEKDEEIAIHGPCYLSINRKRVEVGPAAGAMAKVSLTTNVPEDLISLLLEDKKATVSNETDIFLEVESDLFRVELVREEGKISFLSVTALQKWKDGNEEKLILTAGQIQFEILIVQTEGTDNSWLVGGEITIDDRESDD
ncbi:MAG: hypothetical protein LIP01_10025 [Tannerellaceae bacterium]|nr:hypothetical protein [Tannerellaceae bacterium]